MIDVSPCRTFLLAQSTPEAYTLCRTGLQFLHAAIVPPFTVSTHSHMQSFSHYVGKCSSASRQGGVRPLIIAHIWRCAQARYRHRPECWTQASQSCIRHTLNLRQAPHWLESERRLWSHNSNGMRAARNLLAFFAVQRAHVQTYWPCSCDAIKVLSRYFVAVRAHLRVRRRFQAR